MISHRGIVLFTRDISDQWLKWMTSTELNLLGIHPYFMQQAKNLDFTINWVNSSIGHTLLERFRKENIEIEYELHASSWLLPRNRFKMHPEWFRKTKGGKCTPDHNLCVSNLDALDHVVTSAKKLAILLPPTTGRYHLWQDDGVDVFCHCAKCEYLSPSDQSLILMNALLEGLREIRPDAKISYLAYLNTLESPKNVKPSKDVFLEFAPIKRRYDIPLIDPNEPRHVQTITKLKSLFSFFGYQNAQILEYWLDDSLFSHYIELYRAKIPFNEPVVRDDIYFYKSLGFDYITSFGAFLDSKYVRWHGMPPIHQYANILQTTD